MAIPIFEANVNNPKPKVAAHIDNENNPLLIASKDITIIRLPINKGANISP